MGGPGASRGRLGSLLGASWGALGAIFFGDEILIVFLIDLGSEKGAQRGGFGEPKWVQNRSKNEDENEDEKKTLLGASWVDLGTFWGVIGRAKTLIFHWFYHYFLKIDVLEDKRHPRAILVRFWSKKGAKMAPKWVPKRIQNRSKNMMDLLIDFEAVLEPPSPGQPPAAPRAGPVEGVRGRHKSVPQELGLQDFDLGLLAWCFVQVLYTP